MPAFEYTAIDDKGREKKGVLEGDNPRQIRQKLREQSLTPLSVNESRGQSRDKKSPAGQSSFRGNISNNDLSLITRQIATLTSSGTTIADALEAVSRQTEKPKIKALLVSVRARVREGRTLASAMSDFPRVFPEIYRATVDAGERSGHLDAVLERLADYTENRQTTRQTMIKALIYPSFLVIAALLIVGFLLAYVVPQVVQVFQEMNQTLPVLTTIVISLSDFVKQWGILIVIGIILLVFLFKRAMRSEKFKMRVHTLLLRIPIVTKLIRGLNTAQFAQTLSILAASGVEVLKALDISAQVISNRPMREAVKKAAVQVREGSQLNKSLERTGYFPPMLLHLIASGEKSGQLDKMLSKAATHQERELNSVLSIFLGLFEPVVILIMGVVVLLIVLAILLPIFNLNTMVG
ncbi:MAG: type II secretion system inner membrane protein GspF [Gammaproteobacteria bacterium]|nr:type II secretion system inner membrane protein GspF [Gammaproteobacteria bacterium]